MPADSPSQPYHLTLIELVFNYALYGGVGYWLGGVIGLCLGGGVITARYAYLIWVAISNQPAAPSSAPMESTGFSTSQESPTGGQSSNDAV